MRTLGLSDPNGNRTRVTGVKGRCPRPLDDGASFFAGNCSLPATVVVEIVVIDHLATKLALCGRKADRQGPGLRGSVANREISPKFSERTRCGRTKLENSPTEKVRGCGANCQQNPACPVQGLRVSRHRTGDYSAALALASWASPSTEPFCWLRRIASYTSLR